MEKALKYPN